MKKATLIGLVMVLLLVSVIPVLAKNNQSNGTGKTQTADVGTVNESNPNGKSVGQGQTKVKSTGRGNIIPSTNSNSRNQNGENKELPFYLQGTITAIDAAAGTITVSLAHGNAQVKMYIGSELSMNISQDVQVFQVTQGDEDGDMEKFGDRDFDHDDDGDMDDDDDRDMDDEDDRDMDDDDDMDAMKEVISIDQLAVGQKVAIHGFAANDVYTATSITVYAWMSVEHGMDD